MIVVTLAIRNFFGGGVKTWLRVGVLSLSFVTIIGLQGLYQGMNDQAVAASRAMEFGGGQYWHPRYDPQDPLTLGDAHGPLPALLRNEVETGHAAPILIVQGFLYTAGDMQAVLLKGIDPGQQTLTLPTAVLADSSHPEAPALIGTRMARETGLEVGDTVTVRWRDARGTFDAEDVRVVQIMNTSVATVDSGQVWLPLATLQRMAGMPDEATLVVVGGDRPAVSAGPVIDEWSLRDLDYLLRDLTAMVRTKMIGGSIAYVILLFLAMLAILDTQILSIFHRRQEIGTLIALGLTRGAVIRLFTLEGALNAVLAAVVGAVYAAPLLLVAARVGLPMPAAVDNSGFSLGERLYPTYSAALVAGTTALVLLVTTIVSYLPTRRIATLKPTDALRGRLA